MTADVLALHPQGGAILVLARAAAVAALLSTMGALLFLLAIAPRAWAVAPGTRADLTARLRRLALASALGAAVLLIVWLLAQTADLAGATGLASLLAALPTVLARTQFGHLLAAQWIATVAAAALLVPPPSPWRHAAALAAALLGVLLQAGHGHGYAMGSTPLLLVDAGHLLAAGAWLGALLPLLLVVRAAPISAAEAAARRFSPLGMLCVALLAITAAWQGSVLVASLPALVGTAYGRVALVKAALFALLLAFAALNHFRFVPALRTLPPPQARRALHRSIALESGAGLAVVIAAGLLSQMEPSMHLQPWWPFAQRFSLSAVREDTDILHEVLLAALVLGASLVLLAASLLARRRYTLAAATAVLAAAIWAAPHLQVLLVPAYPTSFYRSPTGFAAASITHGEALFAANCTGCHGARGTGDGPAAAALPVPPADLTAAHLWMHEDGELFWWLTHGITAPDGRQAMPGFAPALSPDDRWALIDDIRANNAGQAAHGGTGWPRPVKAPRLSVTCGATPMPLQSLAGRFVRLVPAPPLPPPLPGVRTCAPADPANDPAAQAYAIVSGLPAAEAAHTEFLIDAAGWLRAMQPLGTPNGWDDPARLAALLSRLRATPVTAPSPDMQMAMPPGMKM